jgi:hypothetical protein
MKEERRRRLGANSSKALTFPLGSKIRLKPGANPTTVIYNASVVKICYTMSSLVRFESKNSLFYLL